MSTSGEQPQGAGQRSDDGQGHESRDWIQELLERAFDIDTLENNGQQSNISNGESSNSNSTRRTAHAREGTSIDGVIGIGNGDNSTPFGGSVPLSWQRVHDRNGSTANSSAEDEGTSDGDSEDSDEEDGEDEVDPDFSGRKRIKYGFKGQVIPGKLKMEIKSVDAGKFVDSKTVSLPKDCERILENNDSVYRTKHRRCNILLNHQDETPFTLHKLVIKVPLDGSKDPVQQGLVYLTMDEDFRVTNVRDYGMLDFQSSLLGGFYELQNRMTDTKDQKDYFDSHRGVKASIQVTDDNTSHMPKDVDNTFDGFDHARHWRLKRLAKLEQMDEDDKWSTDILYSWETHVNKHYPGVTDFEKVPTLNEWSNRMLNKYFVRPVAYFCTDPIPRSVSGLEDGSQATLHHRPRNDWMQTGYYDNRYYDGHPVGVLPIPSRPERSPTPPPTQEQPQHVSRASTVAVSTTSTVLDRIATEIQNAVEQTEEKLGTSTRGRNAIRRRALARNPDESDEQLLYRLRESVRRSTPPEMHQHGPSSNQSPTLLPTLLPTEIVVVLVPSEQDTLGSFTRWIDLGREAELDIYKNDEYDRIPAALDTRIQVFTVQELRQIYTAAERSASINEQSSQVAELVASHRLSFLATRDGLIRESHHQNSWRSRLNLIDFQTQLQLHNVQEATYEAVRIRFFPQLPSWETHGSNNVNQAAFRLRLTRLASHRMQHDPWRVDPAPDFTSLLHALRRTRRLFSQLHPRTTTPTAPPTINEPTQVQPSASHNRAAHARVLERTRQILNQLRPASLPAPPPPPPPAPPRPPRRTRPRTYEDLPQDQTITITFSPPISGRYVLLKLWNPRAEPIDLRKVECWGWCGPRQFPALEMV